MLPLCGQAVISRHGCPTIGQNAHAKFSNVDHRFDREHHARQQNHAGARFAVMRDLWLVVIDLANAVAAKITHDGEAHRLDVALNGVPDVAQPRARLHGANAAPHGSVGCLGQSFSGDARLADVEHAAGVAVIAVDDHRDVNVEDVAVLQFFVARNAVANDVIHRRANRLRERVVLRAVTYVDRDTLLRINDE